MGDVSRLDMSAGDEELALDSEAEELPFCILAKQDRGNEEENAEDG